MLIPAPPIHASTSEKISVRFVPGISLIQPLSPVFGNPCHLDEDILF